MDYPPPKKHTKSQKEELKRIGYAINFISLKKSIQEQIRILERRRDTIEEEEFEYELNALIELIDNISNFLIAIVENQKEETLEMARITTKGNRTKVSIIANLLGKKEIEQVADIINFFKKLKNRAEQI